MLLPLGTSLGSLCPWADFYCYFDMGCLIEPAALNGCDSAEATSPQRCPARPSAPTAESKFKMGKGGAAQTSQNLRP
jgi:hypothetical protein